MNLKLTILILVTAILTSCSGKINTSIKKTAEITPETALQHYLNNGDDTYKWEIKDEYPTGEATAYDLLLTSQKWREHVWVHQLTIIVPKELKHDGALLFITGGSVKDDLPNWASKEDKGTSRFAHVAQKNKAIVAIVRQTPKQPLYNGLVEDQLISFTLHNFKKDKDYSWPLLFPMVKSATSAMTAIQEFSNKNLNHKVNGFTVAGGSKRGWTTWLTGANDKRVEAIGPMVIDVLNMPVSLDYQVEAWNEYSIQIEDYTKLEIPQTVNSEEGNALTKMIDPYSYRKSLTMPKMIFIGTNDEYWPVDAIKNYIKDIPGENYIHYVPNAGHDLNGGEQAIRALSAFWGKTLENKPYNKLSYEISSNNTSATLSVKGSTDDLLGVYLWSADSEDRDFRDEEFVSEQITNTKSGEVKYLMSFPKNGYKAFYIDLEYADPNGGKYTKSTRMYVSDNDEIL